MLIKLVLIVLVITGFFTISLLVSYEGFHTTPDLRTQTSSEDVDSICKKMNSILQSHDISYAQVIRAINTNQLHSLLNNNDVSVIEKCLQGELPQLSSYLITKKIGFVEGIGTHDAKGKARILTIENNDYLRLESFEINYDPETETGFNVPDLHVYFSNDNKLSPHVYVDKLV